MSEELKKNHVMRRIAAAVALLVVFGGVLEMTCMIGTRKSAFSEISPFVNELQRRADYIRDPANHCVLDVHKKPEKNWDYMLGRPEYDDGRMIWSCDGGLVLGMDDADARKIGIPIQEPK